MLCAFASVEKSRSSRTAPPSMNKAAHPGFETQRRRHQKSETGVSVVRKNGHVYNKNLKKKKKKENSQIG